MTQSLVSQWRECQITNVTELCQTCEFKEVHDSLLNSWTPSQESDRWLRSFSVLFQKAAITVDFKCAKRAIFSIKTYRRDLHFRPTTETTKRDQQKRPTKWPAKETYKRDLQKRPAKETYKRDLQKGPTKESVPQELSSRYSIHSAFRNSGMNKNGAISGLFNVPRWISLMTETCHKCEWSCHCLSKSSHMSMSHVTRANESDHTFEWVMSHVWMSHVTGVN